MAAGHPAVPGAETTNGSAPAVDANLDPKIVGFVGSKASAERRDLILELLGKTVHSDVVHLLGGTARDGDEAYVRVQRIPQNYGAFM